MHEHSNHSDPFRRLGLGGAPMILRIYLFLLALFFVLTLFSFLPFVNAELQAFAVEGFNKTLLALLGALSVAGEAYLRKK